MPRALVVNCSAKHYNLGAAKLSDWLATEGYTVESCAGDPGLFGYDFDLMAMSVIFSWHASLARDIALRYRDHTEIWCGGPGMFALARWWKEQIGLECHRGLDDRFDHQRGNYRMTFASRGCPVGCAFCLVPAMEGRTQTLDWDFQPAPILCDNNLSALPVEFQEHIIRRYQETGTPLLDANSGFEPRTFNGATYERWKGILKGPWRFAYDEMGETEQVREMMQILKNVNPKRKRVYVLTGNEPIASCYERAMKVLEWGGEPYCQHILPLNWLGDPSTLKERFDWAYQLGKDFSRYFNRFLWKYVPIWEYSRRVNERPPFAHLKPRLISIQA